VRRSKAMSENVLEQTRNLDRIAAKLYKNEGVAETISLLFSNSGRDATTCLQSPGNSLLL
jgi:hypothetical protein